MKQSDLAQTKFMDKIWKNVIRCILESVNTLLSNLHLFKKHFTQTDIVYENIQLVPRFVHFANQISHIC